MVVMFARMQRGGRRRGTRPRRGRRPSSSSAIWSPDSRRAARVRDLRVGGAATGHLLSWDTAGPYLAGGIVISAALYQLTRGKDACLRHCRSPFRFLTRHWRPGAAGPADGVIHGGWCVGCCWALMASLFALGLMSLGWMAFIAALIAVEKLLPRKEVASRGIALLLLWLGLLVAFSPGAVPGLRRPGLPQRCPE